MRSQKSCNKLKAAFLSLLSAKGEEPVRIIDVLHRAGVSKTTFYTYYENIDQLACDMIDGCLNDLESYVERGHKKTTHQVEDYDLISRWIVEEQDVLTVFCETKYKDYLEKSLYQYLAKLIGYHQKVLSGNLDYSEEQGGFFAYAYVGSVFDGLERGNTGQILKSGKMLGEMVTLAVKHDMDKDKQFFPFRNTARQCRG